MSHYQAEAIACCWISGVLWTVALFDVAVSLGRRAAGRVRQFRGKRIRVQLGQWGEE